MGAAAQGPDYHTKILPCEMLSLMQPTSNKITIPYFIEPSFLPMPSFILATMTSGNIVHDPFLQSVLAASIHARQQCLQLIDLAERSAVAPSETLPFNTKFQLSAKQRQLNADLANLRQSSRESIFEVRATKQDTAEARQEVDRLHLQLQNLYYEERHLRGEISACESYEYVTSYLCLSFKPTV